MNIRGNIIGSVIRGDVNKAFDATNWIRNEYPEDAFDEDLPSDEMIQSIITGYELHKDEPWAECLKHIKKHLQNE